MTKRISGVSGNAALLTGSGIKEMREEGLVEYDAITLIKYQSKYKNSHDYLLFDIFLNWLELRG